MNADPELDAALRRQAGVALGHAVLRFDRAAHGVDDAPKLDEAAVAGAFHHAPMVRVDGGIDEIAAKPRSRDSVRSSSAPASRLWPTTSATRIAAVAAGLAKVHPSAIVGVARNPFALAKPYAERFSRKRRAEAMGRNVALGRFDLFAKPTINDRYSRNCDLIQRC